MKSILKVCFTIIISILLSIGLSIVLNAVGRQPLEVTYRADFSAPEDGGAIWFTDLTAHTSWLCAQHPTPFPVEERTEITATVRMMSQDYNIYNYELTMYPTVDRGGSFSGDYEVVDFGTRENGRKYDNMGEFSYNV